MHIWLLNLPVWDLAHAPLNLPTIKAYVEAKGFEATAVDLNALVTDAAAVDMTTEEHWLTNDNVIDTMLLDAPPTASLLLLDRELERLPIVDGDVIALSLYRPGLLTGMYVARQIKSRFPNTLIVAGGIHATVSGRNLLEVFDGVDVVYLGSAEAHFEKVLMAWDEKRSIPSDLAGVLTRQNRLPDSYLEAQHLELLDDLPYADFSDLDLGMYDYPILPIQTSRGCVGKCAFCGERKYWGRYREKGARRVVDEIEHLTQVCGIHNFAFVDSLVNANPRRLEEICKWILRKGLDIRWGAFARPDRLSPGLAQNMYASGCRYLKFGMESGCQRMLSRMNKMATVQSTIEGLAAASDAGIWTHTFWVVGFPGETHESIAETMQFIEANESHISSACAQGFVLYPHSDVAEDPAKYQVTHVRPSKPDKAAIPDWFQEMFMDWWEYEPLGGLTIAEIGHKERCVNGLITSLGIPTPATNYQDQMMMYAYGG